MGKIKKQTREERLRKKRLAERKRYEKIKNNEELWKAKQEKNRLNYIRRKEENKQLPINEMNPRQQRLQRKRWRKNYKAYYLRKKQEKRTAALILENTPPLSPSILSNNVSIQEDVIRKSPVLEVPFINSNTVSPIPTRSLRSMSLNSNDLFESNINTPTTKSSSCLQQTSSPIRRLRYKKDKEISNLKHKILSMKRLNERYRKALERIKVTHKKNTLPIIQNKPISDNTKIKPIHCANNVPNTLRMEVEIFYEDDENSRLCSGKKEYIVRKKIRKQKRYLNDTLLNLHKKFLKISNVTISYSAFCKLRPFWVLQPDIQSRDTCLCKLHTNMGLLIKALNQRKIVSASTSQDLSIACCDVYNENCVLRECKECQKNKISYLEFDNSVEMTYWQWQTKQNSIQGTGRKIRTVEKTKIEQEPKKCIEYFESILDEYFIHCGNTVAQQKAFKNLKENLQEGECIIHIDFSENYAVKCNEEIQSYHFGGSRKQITLHTSVIYFRDDELKQQVQSFCTVSECLRHDISAVWAHIVPVLEYIGGTKSNIHTVHFISDSPSSQYRNKKIFHMVPCLHMYLNTIKTITWNYNEAGHGKGAPDGVGAVMKRTADRAVSQGKDIKNLDDFINIVSQIEKIKMHIVSDYEVGEKDLLFPQKIKSFPGCMKMHQFVWNLDTPVIAVRKLSCTDKYFLYQAIRCSHSKHLGLYYLDDRCQKNFIVTPLASSSRVLADIGESFWKMTEKESSVCENTITRAKDRKRKEMEKKSKTGTKSNAKENIKSKKPEALAEIDNISDITFSKDRNHELSIDLENINPYLIDSESDDDFNIF